ncbi:zinc-binding alcohol dehydrogenase family protein [Aquabacterium sp. CECT 9606]|uniref:zinc-binding alcohol dehydrogenase family protein n=1 Tax=Aquabacterium sp. CECT 9606 TaxID=2845822 RepID=UPI001E32D20A|nr:zinc-binding alcohol dehydrogenase family protein [Aquabacterium sp. CECT 9606]CAH0350838.1 Zinc-type alcohol dehydrogenase-like protein [Aquabacterium sp. CECT 9606]
MKAVGYHQNLPLSHPECLLDLDLPEPTPGPRDLLVQVHAISVNPVDLKVRASTPPVAGQAKVLGWDAAGVVLSVGEQVRHFKSGDRVWYAGSIGRAGSNAERQVVDERIVSHMPTSLDFAQAAALPLTAITAWELLFDRLGVQRGGGQGQRLLVVGASGGVGSILVQLARQFTQLQVIGTASRPETADWVHAQGAHHVIDHSQPLNAELARIGVQGVHLVASLTHTDRHFEALVEALLPQGKLALIDDPATPIDARLLKRKSLSLHWEMMFARSVFETPDMAEQGALLAQVAQGIDQGVLRSTVTRDFGTVTAAHLKEAHAWVDSGRAIGKGVLSWR